MEKNGLILMEQHYNVNYFNSLLADLKAKGYMEANTAQ